VKSSYVAVINGKSISSSDVSGQVALQLRHEARHLPKRFDFGKPCHEAKGSVSFSDVRSIVKLHELADQVRILTLNHRIVILCQPIFKVIEGKHNSVNDFFKQLLAIGL
jgi:hypothetical protein